MRYLTTLSSIIVDESGTLDEAHTKILATWKRNKFKSAHEVIDTWTEPGRRVEKRSEDDTYVLLETWEAP